MSGFGVSERGSLEENIRVQHRLCAPMRASARRHPAVASAVAAIVAVILINAAVQHDLLRALLYVGVLGLSVVLVDAVLGPWPPDRSPASRTPTVVRSAGFETGVLAVSFVAGFLWLYARFVGSYQPAPGPFRLVWLVLLIACVFQALPALFLIARRYGLRDLGLRIGGIQAAPLIIALFGLAAMTLSPSTTTWKAIVEDSGGSTLAVVEEALLAAVPEEFLRFAWQTRVGAWLKQPALGWLVASVLWAFLHAPKDWDESHSVVSTLMGVVNIVPLGLLWGYLTHRTRSILPSVLLHATNIWGLQNLS